MSQATYDNKSSMLREYWIDRKLVLDIAKEDLCRPLPENFIDANEWEDGKITGNKIAILGCDWCPCCDEVHFITQQIEENPLMDDLPLSVSECNGCGSMFERPEDTELNNAMGTWYYSTPEGYYSID